MQMTLLLVFEKQVRLPDFVRIREDQELNFPIHVIVLQAIVVPFFSKRDLDRVFLLWSTTWGMSIQETKKWTKGISLFSHHRDIIDPCNWTNQKIHHHNGWWVSCKCNVKNVLSIHCVGAKRSLHANASNLENSSTSEHLSWCCTYPHVDSFTHSGEKRENECSIIHTVSLRGIPAWWSDSRIIALISNDVVQDFLFDLAQILFSSGIRDELCRKTFTFNQEKVWERKGNVRTWITYLTIDVRKKKDSMIR